MRLKDINKFIQDSQIKEVTSTRIFDKNGFDPNGLFSEEIFGKVGSPARKQRFGWVNLHVYIIHPEVYDTIVNLCDIFKNMVKNEMYVVVENGELKSVEEPIPDALTGISGIIQILKNNLVEWDKICLNSKNEREIKFIKENLDKIIVDKWLILPAGIRDIRIVDNKRFVQDNELNNLYTNLIASTQNVDWEMLKSEPKLMETVVRNVQRIVNDINTQIKNKIKGGNGLIRGKTMGKRVDYSGRFYLNTDSKIPMGSAGLPYNYVLKLFELPAINIIMTHDDYKGVIAHLIGKETNELTVQDLKDFFTKIAADPAIVEKHPDIKSMLIDIAKQVSKDRQIVYKRDPVENRDSWIAADVIVLDKGEAIRLNPVDFPRMGADVDGDTIGVYAVLSEEANEEAREKLNPKYAQNSVWYSTTSYRKIPYSIELDAAAAIYRATAS